ncbi:MAG: hypothetical protein AAF851_05605 [Myxococcota bacterium]
MGKRRKLVGAHFDAEIVDLLDYMVDQTGKTRREIIEKGIKMAADRAKIRPEEVEAFKMRRINGERIAELLELDAPPDDAEERT